MTTICQQIASDYPALAELAMAREAVGLERYGQVVDAIGDPRDWKKEAAEELIDALVYLYAERERRSSSGFATTLGVTIAAVANALWRTLDDCNIGGDVRVDASDIATLVHERDYCYRNLAATQQRCNELLAENRELRARVNVAESTAREGL